MTTTETRPPGALATDPCACPTCGLWQRTAQAAAVCPDPAHAAERTADVRYAPLPFLVVKLLAALDHAERGGATVMRIDAVRAIVGATVAEVAR